MSIDALCELIIKKQNPTVMGLDPNLAHIPQYIKDKAKNNAADAAQAASAAILEFNKGLIDAACDLVPAVKPQSAYYEAYGYYGVRAFHETVKYAKSKGLYVIADVKRGDIGATAAAYAKAYLGGGFDCDSCTVAPYLGSDGITPFVETAAENGRSVFVLVKTSNKSSGELQDLHVNGEPVYRIMARLVEKLGSALSGKYGYSSCGAVVGATYPKQLAELRKSFANTFFLVPGYGAQGAGAADVAGGFDSRGLGAIINSSRAIAANWQKEGCDERDFAASARREVERMKNALLGALGGKIG